VRQPVRASGVELIGKEAKRWEEQLFLGGTKTPKSAMANRRLRMIFTAGKRTHGDKQQD
jgi:hypothetical protein